jgi:hypothetical protein
MQKAQFLRLIAEGLEQGFKDPIGIDIATDHPKLQTADLRGWRTWAAFFGINHANGDRKTEMLVSGRERVSIRGNGVEVLYLRDVVVGAEAAQQAVLG